MTLPTGVRGRVLALSILLIPLILVARFVLWPWFQSYATTGDDLVSTQNQIVHYRRLLSEQPALRDAVDRLERTRPLSPYLLAGTNRALAAAGLQKQLQDAAEKRNVTILSLRVQNPASVGPLERISVEARLRAGIPELRDLLYWIETARPYLFIEDLSVNARRAGRRTRTPGGLEVRLTLHGLRDQGRPTESGSSNG